MTAHTKYSGEKMTGEPQERRLSRQLTETWPGQASFAVLDCRKECRQCLHWQYSGYDGQRNLKQSPCAKAKSMFGGKKSPKFPGWAIACKFFEAGKDYPRHSGMDGDYRQVNGPTHLWRETRRAYKEATEEGRAGDVVPLATGKPAGEVS